MFETLIGSVKEAGRIRRGEKKPSRMFAYDPLDIKAIRSKAGLSQNKFALMIGVPLKTYQKWE